MEALVGATFPCLGYILFVVVVAYHSCSIPSIVPFVVCYILLVLLFICCCSYIWSCWFYSHLLLTVVVDIYWFLHLLTPYFTLWWWAEAGPVTWLIQRNSCCDCWCYSERNFPFWLLLLTPFCWAAISTGWLCPLMECSHCSPLVYTIPLCIHLTLFDAHFDDYGTDSMGWNTWVFHLLIC